MRDFFFSALLPLRMWPILGLAWSSLCMFSFWTADKGEPEEKRYFTCWRVQGIGQLLTEAGNTFSSLGHFIFFALLIWTLVVALFLLLVLHAHRFGDVSMSSVMRLMFAVMRGL